MAFFQDASGKLLQLDDLGGENAGVYANKLASAQNPDLTDYNALINSGALTALTDDQGWALQGWNPNNRRFGGDGYAEVFNDKTQQWERANGPDYTPISIAQQNGDSYLPLANNGDTRQSAWGEFWSGPGAVLSMPFTAGLGSTLAAAYGGGLAGQLGATATIGAGKAALSGGDVFKGAVSGLPGTLLSSGLGSGAGTSGAQSFNSPNFADSGFNTGGANMAFTDTYGGFDGPDTSFLSDPNYGYTDFGSNDYLNEFGGANANDPTSQLTGGINGQTIDLSNSDYLTPATSVGGDGLTSLLKSLAGGAKSLFGGGADAGSLLKSLGLGGTSGSDFLSKAAASVPILAAINYAQNQGSPDFSQLDASYNALDPQAAAGLYDINTGSGKSSLAASLAQRGVSGSSFANQDMTNFDTTRDVGRAALVNSGVSQQAQIAAAKLAAQTAAQKNKNDLYGRSLLALGSVFAPRGGGINLGGA